MANIRPSKVFHQNHMVRPWAKSFELLGHRRQNLTILRAGLARKRANAKEFLRRLSSGLVLRFPKYLEINRRSLMVPVIDFKLSLYNDLGQRWTCRALVNMGPNSQRRSKLFAQAINYLYRPILGPASLDLKLRQPAHGASHMP